MTALPRVQGAHLVGSINQPTATDTFRIVAANLGTELARIPDGEVGERFHWMLFQGQVFDATPGLARLPIEPIMHVGFDLRPLTLDSSVAAAELVIGELGYAQAATDSYAAFLALRSEGVIAEGTRFQVCLPSALAPLTTYIATVDRSSVYPAYEAALQREIAAIAAAIPAADLAIQIDMATEFAYIEGTSLGGGPLDPWFAIDPSRDAIIAGCVRLGASIASAVPDDVELGFHLCYGDVGEKHFVEPTDSEALVAVANGLTAEVTRPITWIHLPVPIDRDDAAYFAPLAELTLAATTTLFLGLVHHEDGVAGATARITAARTVLAAAGVEEFGIGTECGFGRGPAERTAGLLALHADILNAA